MEGCSAAAAGFPAPILGLGLLEAATPDSRGLLKVVPAFLVG